MYLEVFVIVSITLRQTLQLYFHQTFFCGESSSLPNFFLTVGTAVLVLSSFHIYMYSIGSSFMCCWNIVTQGQTVCIILCMFFFFFRCNKKCGNCTKLKDKTQYYWRQISSKIVAVSFWCTPIMLCQTFCNAPLIVLGPEQINTDHKICMQILPLINAVRAFVREKLKTK